jgi:hypothetical protein
MLLDIFRLTSEELRLEGHHVKAYEPGRPRQNPRNGTTKFLGFVT